LSGNGGQTPNYGLTSAVDVFQM